MDSTRMKRVIGLGVLIAVAAILDVQRVQLILLRQSVQFGAVGVVDLMPLH